MPLRTSARLISASGAALLWLLAFGCAPPPRNHYVKSAETNLVSIPLVPAVQPGGKNGDISLSLQAGYRAPERTDFKTKPVFETTPEPGSNEFRGEYAIRKGPLYFGVEMREKAIDVLDWYATTNVHFESGTRGSGLIGIGITIPFPLLNVRLSPAAGFHGYTNRVVDSVISYHESISIGFLTPDERTIRADTTTHIIDNGSLRLGLLGSFSVSAWPPNRSGRNWTPYLQYQAHWIGMGAKDSAITVPRGIMVLHGRIVALGMEYAPMKSVVWNTRLASEYLWNRQDGRWGYRVETGIGLRLPD